MNKPSEAQPDWVDIRKKIMGLGERAGRKSYYPQLHARIQELEEKSATLLSMLTERDEARRRAEDSEKRFRLLFEHITDGILVMDIETGQPVMGNESIGRMLGYGKEELPDLSLADVLPSADPLRAGDKSPSGVQNKAEGPIEASVKRRDGSTFWAEIRIMRLDLGGRPSLMMVFHDISERKRAEAEILRGRALLRSLIDSSPDLIFFKDSNSVYLGCNKAFEAYAGRPESELVGHTDFDFFDRESAESYRRKDREMLAAGRTRRYEEWVTYPSGQLVLLDTLKTPYYGPDGEVLGVLGVSRDITEHKRAEEERTRVESQLRQAQKMEALGTLAGGIAHDFNNILGVILGYAEIGQLEAGEGAPVSKDLQEVLKAAHRAKDLVRQILAFSCQKEQEKKPVQVGPVVKEVMKMLRASLPSTIEIKMNLTSRGVVMADPTQVHQVLMNLCTNAAHAMLEKGGVLEVTLSDVHLEPQDIKPHSGLQPGSHVKLTVTDTGHGMEPGVLDRIFDPFFTTKEQGTGTGLGLSVVHGIVKSHEGGIEVNSVPGKGTTFRVFFPARQSAPASETVEAAPIPHGREKLLIVDDEPALATATTQMLECLGYEVDYRTNGLEALEAFRHQSDEKPYALVITDMTMPHMTGVDLARELLKLRPNLPILLCTGFSEKSSPERAKSLGFQGFLMKPFGLRELAGTVRKMLEKDR
ncbi:MAG: PAS domain S-box protein [Deltaproteobacteria bacterium]|nr:PAS domain S-box protein [Deltaproteobacteria bacterium]